MNRWITVLLLLSMLSLGGCATSAGGHKQATDLAITIKRLADQGATFNQRRDALARARLKNVHQLVNSTSRVEHENIADLQTWKVVGASDKLNFYNETIATIARISDYRQKEENRLNEQEKALKEYKSKVDFKKDKLATAANQLATISKEDTTKEKLSTYLAFLIDIKEKVEEAQKEGEASLDGLEDGMDKFSEKIAKEL